MLWINEGEAASVANQRNIFLRLLYAMLGFYWCEWASSLRFDLDFLTGKRKFKWPLIFYYLCRYIPFVHFAILPRMLNEGSWPLRFNPHHIDCRPLYSILHVVGHGSVALASNNLALRVMALWPGNYYIRFALWSMILGQWAIIISAAPLVQLGLSVYPVGPTECHGWFVYIPGNSRAFAYALGLDLLILGLTLYKLIGINKISLPRRRDGQVRYIVFSQATSYMIIAVTINLMALLATRLFLTGLVIDFIVPFQVFAPLLACRMVRHLTTFSDDEAIESTAQNTKNRTSIQFKHTVASEATSSEHPVY
ncbi:hypothetical protein CPB83DRAFT_104724 [Crepidotus variabilis]|uniref:Uncharacterized protein n=1 Tax=Crepidotus variabilis TaxID=179855 RepID=A0A9P6EMC0_9AGAR|nr:hypothetical protein CPB83DRAFT_104724 [Crepidotus variabilis]